MLGTGAFAAEIPYTVLYDYTNNAMTVSGVAEGSRFVTLQLLAEGTKAEDYVKSADNGKVLWRGQNTTEDGTFSFRIGYDSELEKGNYEAVLTASGESEKTYPVFYIASSSDYAEAAGTLVDLAKQSKKDEFKEFVTTNNNTLGFDFTLYNEVKNNKVLDLLYAHVKAEGLSETDAKKNTKLFNSLVLAEALNKKAISNIEDYIGATTLADCDAYSDYKAIAETESEQKYLTSKMLGVDIDSVDALESALVESIVLSYIYNASGYGDVRDILAEYGELFGIEGSTSTTVCKELCGMDFDNSADFISTYNTLKKKYASSGGSSGGSGGSSGGGGGSSSGAGYMNGRYEGVEQNNDIHKIEVSFNDIDGVEWASEAIVALADMGIVNGESEGYFRPNTNITREEFAKILVCTMGFENDAYAGNVFSDVAESDWFCSYVNIAYEKGLVKGIGNGMFGTGAFITRQDMSVMLYNAMQMSGKDIAVAELAFEDAGTISDYAVSAVGALYGLGIVNGVSETTFEPQGNATRAQAAKVVYGALDYLQ